MKDRELPQSTLVQLFGLLNSAKIQEFLATLGADKYVKKLKTMVLIQMVALAQVMQLRSLRDISNMLNDDSLSRQLSIESITAGQISRRLRSLPPEVAKIMLNTTRLEAVKGTGMNAVTQCLGNLHLTDSSTITLCVSRYGWAKFRKTKSGVKLHLRLKFVDGDVVPDKVIVTNAKVSDKSQMDELVVEEKDALNVFDRGYVEYKKFDHYCANGIRFVTRIKGNAVIEIVEDRPLHPGSPIKRDSTVYLGVPGDTRMVNPLRLLETEDSEGKPVRILPTTSACQLKRYAISIG